ncbi:MAG: iron-containing alcohol dehydrogenase [Lactobacillales bacterium]|jgi:alcohol dehydrogenase YqhD (iron-dependent ADH family)|nr:iron-containing alcohol dehydrogenase [Lactobacillales bacterium]
MKSFEYNVYTHMYVGSDFYDQIPVELAKYGKNVLFIYGGGSIKRNGLYDKVISELGGFNVIELSGIEPNPRIEKVREGVEICKTHNIDVLLPVGGGSTVDTAKAIAAGAKYDGDAWDFFSRGPEHKAVGDSLPIVDVLTLAATGTEMNRNAVVSNLGTQEKYGLGGETLLPKASFLDPVNTFTVSKYQTAAGSADILSHLMENFFKRTTGADVQDFVNIALQKAVIKNAYIALVTPEDYDARANLLWASSLALGGIPAGGKPGAWTCHAIEHELSAFYDITHGVGLAIITPRFLNHIIKKDKTATAKIAEYARGVFDINEADDTLAALKGIQLQYETFKKWGIPMTLQEVGIDGKKLREMSEHAVKHGNLEHGDSFVSLTADDVEAILVDSLTESEFH